MSNINKEELMRGLSDSQVNKSKQDFGTNALAKKETESLWSMFIGAFDDIWIKVLCAALVMKIVISVIGVFVPALAGENDVVEIISIVLAIALATGFSTLSEYRNSSRSEALQEEYNKTYAKVMRNGKLVNILTSEIVKGDTILVQAGDKVPTDGVLFEGHIKVSQAALNGESRDENKTAADNLDEEHKMIREIENYLKTQSADPGDSIKLPEQLNGKKLIWNTKKEHLSEKILFLGGGIVIILPFVEQSRKKEREKKRKALLELQYADMVSNLALLLGAGMTVSKAWNRLTENYMNERQKRTICRKEVYEEMQRTSFEIKNGMGEERAYERFGERCGGYRYRKFGNLLAQNLRKGSRGLTRLLEQEAEDAFEERKSMARKLGEEAGTKMLFPMILMLGAVMLILAFPAMRSMEL